MIIASIIRLVHKRDFDRTGFGMKNAGKMKVSIVTAVYNRAVTIGATIESVLSQTASDNIEYILVDAMSDDGTSEIVSDFEGQIAVSIREPDNGIYDALNKGIEASSGDVVGFVHADDLLASSRAIELVIERFESLGPDALYGDLTYVNENNLEEIVRYWRAGQFNQRKFRMGWMPPHPTVYVKKNIYKKFGGYRTDLGSGADYECMLRLMYSNRISVAYLPEVLVKMRLGGESNVSFGNRMKANRSDRQAWIENNLKPPFGLRITKPLSKLPQYFSRPK